MKKIMYLFSMVLFIGMASCSSVKITDSWKADDIGSIVNEDLLVIARTDDMVARQRFEQEIAERLRAKGLKATESYKKFPNMNQNKKLTEQELKDRVNIIKAEGFEGVVLTVLRDKKKEVVTSQTGGYVAGGYYPSYYGPYYGGFGMYYGSVYSPYGYGYGGAYVPAETRTYTSETYLVETVVYDLRRPAAKQLVAVVSTEVTDPKSASKIAPEYAEAVAKALTK